MGALTVSAQSSGMNNMMSETPHVTLTRDRRSSIGRHAGIVIVWHYTIYLSQIVTSQRERWVISHGKFSNSHVSNMQCVLMQIVYACKLRWEEDFLFNRGEQSYVFKGFVVIFLTVVLSFCTKPLQDLKVHW